MSVAEFCQMTKEHAHETNGGINSLWTSAYVEKMKGYADDTTVLTIEDKRALEDVLNDLASVYLKNYFKDLSGESPVYAEGLKAVRNMINSWIKESTTLGELIMKML